MELISYVLNVFNNIFLKMTWLNDGIGWIISNVFNMPIGINTIQERIGGSLQFFVYDVIKIYILLSILIFIFSYIESNFTPEKTKRILSNFKGIKGNIFGALLGTVTPFCSCSSIPIFISFTKAGLPLGVTFSFLISSPFVDMAAIVMLASIFGIKVAIVYALVGVILAVIGGYIIGKLKMEDQIEEYVLNMKVGKGVVEKELTTKEKIQYAKDQVKEIFGRVWKYVLIGVGIGALIHNWIPQQFIETILGDNNPFAVVIAVLVGVPMYADIFGTLPIAEALISKGVGIGTVLSFMMAVTALSLPSMIMIKKVIKKKLFITFVSIVVIGIILIGYVFNAFQSILV